MQRPWLALMLAPLVLCAPVWADGGSLLVRSPGAHWEITALGSPDPLRVGDADLSVLITERDSGRPVLDARVELVLRAPASAGPPQEIHALARLGAGTNGLLYSAWPRLTSPGRWELEIVVEQGDATQRAATPLEVAAANSALLAHWPALAFPPLGIALFAIHQTLARRRHWRGDRS